MPRIVIPKMQRVVVPETSDGDLRRPGYEVEVGKNLVRYRNGSFAGGKTQEQAIELLAQEGCQLPNMSFLWHLAETEGVESEFFIDTFARTDGVYRWEHTGTKLVKAGKDPYIRDVFEYHGRWIQIAEGQRMPLGGARIIVESNPITGLPLATTDDLKAEHIGHWYFNPDLPENVVLFGSYWCDGERGGCFGTDANYGPSVANDYYGFRPVRLLK